MNRIPWYQSPVFTAGLAAFVMQISTMFDEAFLTALFEGKSGAMARATSLIFTAVIVGVRAASSVQPLTFRRKNEPE